MKSSAYLYKLLGNEGVVRRDLPQASPVSSLATPIDTVEAEALASRIHSSARNFSLLASLRPPQPQQPKLVSTAEGVAVRFTDEFLERFGLPAFCT